MLNNKRADKLYNHLKIYEGILFMITLKMIEEMVKVAEEEGMLGLEKLLLCFSTLAKPAKQKHTILNSTCGDINTLHLAISQQKLKAVHVLLEAGVDLHIRNSKGQTALHVASELSFIEGIRALLSAGADINAKSKYHTPLEIVASALRYALDFAPDSDITRYEKNLEIFVLFLNQKKIDLNAHSQGGWALSELWRSGAGLHALVLTGEQWMTRAHRSKAITYAMNNHHIDVLNFILKITKNFEEKDMKDALMEAVLSNFPAGIHALRKIGLSVDFQDPKVMNRSPLMVACLMRNIETLQALIEAKADLELQDTKGNTALHLAASYGFVEGVRALLAAGANINALNKANETPFTQLEYSESQLGSFQALIENGAQPQFDTYDIAHCSITKCYILMENDAAKLVSERLTSENNKLIVKFYQLLSPFLQKEYLNFLAVKIENKYLTDTENFEFDVEKIKPFIASEANMACEALFKDLGEHAKKLKESVKDIEELEQLKTILKELLGKYLENFYFKEYYKYGSGTGRMFPISSYRGTRHGQFHEDPIWQQPYREIMMFEDWCETSRCSLLPAKLVSLINDYLYFTPVSDQTLVSDQGADAQKKANTAALDLREKLVNFMKKNKKSIMEESHRLTASRRTADTIPGSEGLIARFKQLSFSHTSDSDDEQSTALLRFAGAGSASGSAGAAGSGEATSAAMNLRSDDAFCLTGLGLSGRSAGSA